MLAVVVVQQGHGREAKKEWKKRKNRIEISHIHNGKGLGKKNQEW